MQVYIIVDTLKQCWQLQGKIQRSLDDIIFSGFIFLDMKDKSLMIHYWQENNNIKNIASNTTPVPSAPLKLAS